MPDLGEKLGESQTSDVYAWGDDSVAKLFKGAIPRAWIDYEAATAKAAAEAGAPAPGVRGVIEIDGRPAIIYQRFDGKTLLESVMAGDVTPAQTGAIMATLDDVRGKGTNESRNLRSIVDRIRPTVEALLATRADVPTETLARHAVRANVRASANHLRHGSQFLERLVVEGRLVVVGAEYALETGEVDFFDGVPPEGGASHES